MFCSISAILGLTKECDFVWWFCCARPFFCAPCLDCFGERCSTFLPREPWMSVVSATARFPTSDFFRTCVSASTENS